MDRYTLIVVLQIFVGLCATFVSLAMALGPTGWSLIVTIISLGKRKIIAVDKIDEIQETQKSLVYTTINDNNSLFMGFFIGKHSSSGDFFVGYDTTDAKTKSRTLYIVLSRTTPFFDKTKKEVVVDNKPNNEFRMLESSGCSNYGNNFALSICSYKQIIPNSEQTNLLNDINTKMEQKRDKHKIVTAFIYGVPKTGKSSICDLILLEQRDHNPIYVRLNLFALGQTFEHFKNNTISNSTVIVIDLGDIGEILKDNFSNLTKSELFNRIVNTKSDWNNFFDDFDRVQYVDKKIYVIATSNVDVKEIDPSYTRSGRFDICTEFSSKII